ncbi:MAG TPA: succinate dehydrogenase, cytochrome b556 subunit [Candidatus Limnocylindrales bacterium]|nr:succinate dehydrogenase, cytochrome b556 subunit [Candidatus Limnocylindrales bacterium]
MTALVTTITETLRYRGAIGQWSWVLHRITGLGVVLFVTLHVVDTSWALFYPELYVHAIASYQTPIFTIGEFFLVACVVYHAYNGIRIAVMDFRPKLWRHQQRAAIIVIILTLITLIPVFLLMFNHVLNFYAESTPLLGIGEVLAAQLPFIAGIAVAIIAALLFSAVVGLVLPQRGKRARRGSNIERFWWSFMRVSGLLILPLVFGHLAMMHVLQGVFDLTAVGAGVVGVSGAVNDTGTAVEFVATRWNFFVAGVAVWRVYDFLLLGLVVLHGFNGLRLVLTDYTAKSPLLRRAAVYLSVIGAVVLLVLGGGALLGTIPESSIEMAQEATERLIQNADVQPVEDSAP